MYANASLAEEELGWKATHTLQNMCKFKSHTIKIVIILQYLFQVKIFGDGKQQTRMDTAVTM